MNTCSDFYDSDNFKYECPKEGFFGTIRSFKIDKDFNFYNQDSILIGKGRFSGDKEITIDVSNTYSIRITINKKIVDELRKQYL